MIEHAGRRWLRSTAAAVTLCTPAIVGVIWAAGLAEGTRGVTMLSGIVRDSNTDEALAGALVTVTATELRRSMTTVTDPEGRFSFSGLPAGSFAISARKAPYAPMAYGARSPGRRGVAIRVRTGESIDDVVLRLPRGAVVTGIIRDQAGRPMPDADVFAIRQSVGVARGSFTATTADDRGVYRIFGLSPGEYVIGATHGIVGNSDHLRVPSSEELDLRFAELERRLLAPDLSRSDASTRRATSAGAPLQLAPTFYPGTSNPAAAAVLELAAGQEAVADISFRPVPFGSLVGTVRTFDGSTLPSVRIGVEIDGPELPSVLRRTLIPSRRPQPPDGAFAYADLTPGTYTLTAVASAPLDRTGARASWWGRAQITATGGDLSGVTLMLWPAFRLGGRVIVDPSASSPLPLDRIRVVLRRAGGGSAGTGSSLAVPVSDTGEFEISGIVGGEHLLTIAAPPGWRVVSATIGDVDVSDRPAVFEPEHPPAEGRVVLSDRSAELFGYIVGSDRIDPTGLHVVVFPFDRAHWHADCVRIRYARVATDGRFVLSGLPGEDYYVAALVDVTEDDLAEPSFLEALVPSAVQVVLGEGQAQRLDLKIAR